MKKNPLYLETSALSVGLGEGISQAKDGLQFPQDKALDNTALCPISFTSKSLTSIETKYSNIVLYNILTN